MLCRDDKLSNKQYGKKYINSNATIENDPIIGG